MMLQSPIIAIKRQGRSFEARLSLAFASVEGMILASRFTMVRPSQPERLLRRSRLVNRQSSGKSRINQHSAIGNRQSEIGNRQ